METAARVSHLKSALHLTAGVLLLGYAVSHVGFLTIPDFEHNLRNTVFPFLTNRTLYVLACVLETFTGFICIIFRGKDRINVVILTFIGMMSWYRWAFYYTGGSSCSCLGLFGTLFHLTQTQEKIIPIASLIWLFATTTPWLFDLLASKLIKPR